MTQAELTRQTRKHATRARILQAAARLYLERGLDGVSIDEVARAADRTKGAVYGHFADKEELLLEVWRAHYAEKRGLIEAALADEPERMARALQGAMAKVFALGPWPALGADVRRRPDYAALSRELATLEREELEGLTAHFLAVSERMGLGMDLDPPEIAAILFALSEGLMLRADLAPELAAARFMIVLRRLTGLDPPP